MSYFTSKFQGRQETQQKGPKLPGHQTTGIQKANAFLTENSFWKIC